MEKKVIAWECECGEIKYGAFPPQECGTCGESNSYIEVPDDHMIEREEDHILQEIRDDDWEDD
jgi:hypothetical protein